MAYTAKTLDAMSGGDSVAVDRIAGRDYQILKIVVGGEGTATEISATTGLPVDGSNFTQPISAASLPLPTGAASETTLSALNGKVTACNTGAVTISAALPAGTNNIGTVDTATPTNGATELSQAIQTASGATETAIKMIGIRADALSAGGKATADGQWVPFLFDDRGRLWIVNEADTSHYQSVGTLTAVKTAAGTIKTINCQNVNAAAAYLQVFNLATGSVTLGTTTPTNQFIIPGNTAGSGFAIDLGDGYSYSTAISIAVTTTAGGSTLITSGEVMTNIGYQ